MWRPHLITLLRSFSTQEEGQNQQFLVLFSYYGRKNNIYYCVCNISKELLNKGATFTRLKGTAIYSINFKGNSYEFYGDFTPSIPYMWGIVLSRRHFWTEILKGSKIKVVVNSYSNHDKIRVFITNNHFYNALLEKKVYLKVDGVTKLNDLIKQENIKRINSNDPLQIPLKIYSKRVDLKRIVKNGKMVLIEGNYDYENITDSISPQIIETAKKVMNSFPRLGYICLELVTEDVRKH